MLKWICVDGLKNLLEQKKLKSWVDWTVPNKQKKEQTNHELTNKQTNKQTNKRTNKRMDGLKPELTSFLREAMLRKSSSLNGSDDDLIFSASTGLAGLASIAGGFDQVLLAAGGGGGALPGFQVRIIF